MEKKSVIILSKDIPCGLQANIASVLCMSLGRYHPELIGEDIIMGDKTTLRGITRIPIPILTAQTESLQCIYSKGMEIEFMVPFTEEALKTKNYEDYRSRIIQVRITETTLYGLLIFGEKKLVNRLSGHLPLLK